MVSALSYEISRVSHYSGFISPSLCFHIQDFHLLWFTFPGNSTNIILGFIDNPNPTNITIHGLGSSCFARHYFRNRCYFLFLWVLRCFSSPRSLPIHYFTHVWIYSLFLLYEFPHSDTHGSMDICSSPWLFAAYHVLLRLLVPRHSPYALCSLTFWLRLNFVLLSKVSIKIFSIYSRIISKKFLTFLALLVYTMSFFNLSVFFIVTIFSMFNIVSIAFGWIVILDFLNLIY